MHATTEIAQAAAAFVVQEGLTFALAKHKAARSFGQVPLPSDEEIEAAIWEHNAIFKTQSQAQELAALRELAAKWMVRLDAFNPHIGGGVWHGWAGAMNAIDLELYTDDEKMLEHFLLEMGVSFESIETKQNRVPAGRFALLQEILWWDLIPEFEDYTPIHARVYTQSGQRGALLADRQGRVPRGNYAALMEKIQLAKEGQ